METDFIKSKAGGKNTLSNTTANNLVMLNVAENFAALRKVFNRV